MRSEMPTVEIYVKEKDIENKHPNRRNEMMEVMELESEAVSTESYAVPQAELTSSRASEQQHSSVQKESSVQK